MIFLFIQKPYSLRHNSGLQLIKDRTVYFGTESVSSLGSKFCELLSQTLKIETPVIIFIYNIKSWSTDKFHLCKRYIVNMGLI